jgi:hypothetical protein
MQMIAGMMFNNTKANLDIIIIIITKKVEFRVLYLH